MKTIALAFFAGAAIGAYVSALWLLHIVEQRAKRYKEATFKLSVTPELAQKIVDECLKKALDDNGLVVMPKGREFTWPKEQR